jgi:hypothetical protein
MKKFIIKPDISLFEGVQVYKDTKLSYKSEDGLIKQELKDMTLKIDKKEKADNYKSKTTLEIFLNEGDILLYDEGRGYFLPSIPMSTIQEGIEDLEAIKDFEGE